MSLAYEFELNKIALEEWKHQDAETNLNSIKFAKQSLSKAIQTELTDKQKQYINEYYVNGLNIKQIAIKYGVNKATVSRTINRGLHRLFKVLRYTSTYTITALEKNIKLKASKNRSRGQKSKKRKSGT